MRTVFLSLLLIIFASQAKAQLGISYAQSSMPYAEINYQLNQRFLAGFRPSVNTLASNFSPEAVINYLFVSKDSHQVYVGLGGRINLNSGAVLPLGVNIYPFENKQFGFQTEVSLITNGNDAIIRGSWGIRYRFNKKSQTAD